MTAEYGPDGSHAARPVTVVSANIVHGGRILVGVRRRTPLALRFPGVLSTPTIRVPPAVFALLTGAYEVPRGECGTWAVAGAPVLVGHSGHPRSVDGFVLDELLSRKLGLAGALVEDRFEATAVPRHLALDRVSDPLGTERAEWTAMLSYGIRVDRGWDEVPESTESYSRLVWAPVDRLPDALARKDALHVDDTLDPFEVCIDGLCMRLAAALIASRSFV